MTPTKDSDQVIEVMALFQKLRDWIDNNPNGLESSPQTIKLSSNFAMTSASQQLFLP
jgi:hypothetical protein